MAAGSGLVAGPVGHFAVCPADLVAVAPDKSFAAYAGISYDTVNKLGVIEPVCTHPAYRAEAWHTR